MLWLCPAVSAQVDRAELGKRLRRFEQAWQAAPDERRQAAALPMQRAVRNFFTLQFADAARQLDDAWFAVRSETDPSPWERAAVAWRAELTPLLSDEHQGSVKVCLRGYYRDVAKLPPPTEVSWRVLDRRQQEILRGVLSWPEAVRGWDVSLPPAAVGDFLLQISLNREGECFDLLPQGFSRIEQWETRIALVREQMRDETRFPEPTQRATLQRWCELVESLAQTEPPEIDVPAAQCLEWAEQSLQLQTKWSEWMAETSRRSDVWLTLASGRKRVHLRMRAPPDAAGPLPVLFLLHGAGGSENMFFETYGAGGVVRAGLARGWLVVAPRQGWGGLRLTIPEMLQILDTILTVDRRQVFLIGHSMGAAEAVAQVSADPDSFHAVAALGGGGRIRAAERNGVQAGELPWFVAAGQFDFGRDQARTLHQSLVAGGALHAVYREYPGVEHLVIVQAANDDVFEFFDDVRRQAK